MDNFVFDDIRDGNTAILEDYWYFIDDETGQVTFKTKMPNELLNYGYVKFVVEGTVYITDLNGNVLLKSTEGRLSEDLKQLPYFNSETKYRTEERVNFDTSKYENVRLNFEWNNHKYYHVGKNEKYAVIDEAENIIIDYDYYPLYISEFNGKPCFTVIDPKTELYGVIDIDKNTIIPFKKYSYLTSFAFFKDEKSYLCAKNAETGLCGIIDINENIVIPFMYDEIHDWNICTLRKTIQVVYKGKCGIIDINNNILLPFKYKYICSFADEYNLNQCSLAENLDGKWGIINRQGNAVEINLENIKELILKG